MTSHVPVFSFGTDYIWKRQKRYIKNSEYNRKTAVYHNVNGDPALLHTSKKAGYKVISSTLTL